MKNHDRKNEDDRKAVKDITPKEENASSVDPDMVADPDAPSAPDESEITSPEETGYAPEDLSSAELSEVSEEALSADIVPSDDPDFEVTEADDMLSSSKDDKWIDAEPVPMELGAHEIHTMISDDDPDAPAFTEISTRPSDAKPNKASKKMNIKPLMFLIVMAIVAVLVLIWSVISLGNLNERMTSPITVGNHDVSNAEFSFMYHYVLLENGVDIFKPDTEKMLQQPGENGFATYREYFLDVTAKEIQATYMLYDDATAHGFSITQDHKDRAQAYVDWLKTKADAIHVDLDTYIKGTFGPYVNKSLILSVLSKVYFTEDYSAHQKLDELKATPEQAEKAYQDARNSYDLVSYRVLRITFEQREESYVKTANLHAEQIIEKIAGDQSKFESTAAQYFSGEAQQRLLVPDSTLHKRVRYSEINESEWRSWLFDTSRASGDTVIFKDDYGFPIIFCFVERVRQDEPLRNVRFFYINLENPETETPGIPASEILPLSQTIFDSITDEASMITLETTYADQLMDGSMRAVQQTSLFPGNNTEKIDDWIFDPQRKSGDKILLEGDTQILILFYVEASPNPEWYDRVNSFIRMDNYQAFVSEKIANYSYTFHEDGLKYIKDIPS